MPNIRLGTATIFAKDLQRMTAFYHDALGLPLLPATSEPG
jgi:catechol-2,3-dioxygenase